MKKNTKKKFRDIRNAVVMMCVMVAMMSTASYAWFTLTDSPTVVGMQMTAASSGGLQVSNKATADFADAITIENTDTQILKPVTPSLTSVGTFETGVYAGNSVTGTIALADITDHVAHYKYYLKSTAASSDKDLNIGIICGDIAQTETMGLLGTQAKLGGSLVRESTTVESGADFTAYAIRVGLVPSGDTLNDGGTMYVWEPNNDGTWTGDKTGATDATGKNETEPHVSSTMVGNITGGVDGNGGQHDAGDGGSVGASTSNTKISGGLFKMKEGSTVTIDMYIWLEGKDEECVNQIQAGAIEAQIQFTVVDDAAAVTPTP